MMHLFQILSQELPYFILLNKIFARLKAQHEIFLFFLNGQWSSLSSHESHLVELVDLKSLF